ncbi:LamG domain-containing protein [Actinopolymorpha pittospori]|uniref:N,N-dimethylformamidase n=1 Tax=Actinopolymorpha pittospori TaxID=648752 RepID=A0A927N654_9ACTN|nr:LamG domain-containing protein [Actinopolymorpha pittospori]MBE1613151.1 N,N-dimethylformamidase [Actinopolymorpha pittospori]
MKVIGYSRQLSVRPGSDVDFFVSCDAESYHADIVRLVHGDTNPEGPGFKVTPVRTGIDSDFPGQVQRTYAGSHVLVEDHPLLRVATSFTLQAYIAPTTPRKGVQGLVTKWREGRQAGYGLFIGADGAVQLWLGDGSGAVQKVTAGKPLLEGTWYFVSASVDTAGALHLRQEPYVTPTNGRFTIASSLASTTAVVTEPVRVIPASDNGVPLVMAGYVEALTDEPIGVVVGGHYNGKLDRPRLHRGALTPEQTATQVEAPGGRTLVAAWNFQEEITSDGIRQTRHISDVSPHRLDGHALNVPTRAATGYNWQGREQNFVHAPEQYGAIHFHDDDLDDVRWRVSFTLRVPDELPSGLYAARLRADDDTGATGQNPGEDPELDTDYVPFYVRPRPGRENKICFLAPTASYIAYANDHVTLWTPIAQLFIARVPVLQQQNIVLSAHRELGLSTYDIHSDGSGVAYSTRLRPILNMRPGFRHWLSPSLWQFNADLYLIDWLIEKGYDFDVVTDQDLHHEGREVLDPYRVVITGSHPEYSSEQMLDALHSYLDTGGRLMYMGANGFYWVINFDPENQNVIEVRKGHGSQAWRARAGEYHLSFTGEYGTIWRFRGRAPQRLVGVGWASEGFDVSSYYLRTPDGRTGLASWMLEGIEPNERIGDFGLVGDGAAGLELDIYDASLGTPPETIIAATSQDHTDVVLEVLEEQYFPVPGTNGSQNPKVRADIVYFPTPEGGGVWSASSIAYCGSLSYNNYDNNVSRLTANVLNRFLSEGPAPLTM